MTDKALSSNVADFEAQRIEISLRNMHYNRFLLIRYATAFFVFLNLYWLIFSLSSYSWSFVLPLALFISAVFVALEQMKIYREHSSQIKWARRFYRFSLIVNIVLMASFLYPDSFSVIYPFITDGVKGRQTIAIMLILQILLSLLVLKKINHIYQNKDKYYRSLQAYKKTLHQRKS